MADHADTESKADQNAQKAYETAAAVEKAVAVPEPADPVLEVTGNEPVTAKPAAEKAPAEKPTIKKTPPKKAAIKKPAKKTTTKRKPATSKLAVATSNLTKQNSKKETIMATKNTAAQKTYAKNADAKKLETVAADLTKTVKESAANAQNRAKDVASDAQARLKSAYGTTSEVASEVTKFSKGNVEAIVESGKILAAGVQDMGREAVADSKTAVEAMTADAKAFAAVRSPTDLFKLQGEIARRNFDTMVSTASANTEKMVKLANESFAPISNRFSVAAEKISKAA